VKPNSIAVGFWLGAHLAAVESGFERVLWVAPFSTVVLFAVFVFSKGQDNGGAKEKENEADDTGKTDNAAGSDDSWEIWG
jgi:hypothetical protein